VSGLGLACVCFVPQASESNGKSAGAGSIQTKMQREDISAIMSYCSWYIATNRDDAVACASAFGSGGLSHAECCMQHLERP
jgi:hypothetical protein